MKKRWHINFYAIRTCIILAFTYAGIRLVACVCVCVCMDVCW